MISEGSLKTGVMVLKIQLYHHRITMFLNYCYYLNISK